MLTCLSRLDLSLSSRIRYRDRSKVRATSAEKILFFKREHLSRIQQRIYPCINLRAGRDSGGLGALSSALQQMYSAPTSDYMQWQNTTIDNSAAPLTFNQLYDSVMRASNGRTNLS